MAQMAAPQRVAQFAIVRKLRGTSRALCRVRLDVAGMPGVELVVDQRMQHDFRFVAGHGRFPSASQAARNNARARRSEEHTSELQSPCNLVCRLLLEKKKKK